MSYHYSKKPSFKNQPHDSPIERVAGRLVVFPTEDHAYVSGSCVRIAKNLYVTAGHVIRDYLERFNGPNNTIEADGWVVHILSASPPIYEIWQIDCAWVSIHSDLAVFHTRPYNDIAADVKQAPCLGLELAPPQCGDRVVGFGYHSPSGRVFRGADGIRHIEVDAFGAATVGEVKEVHLQKRDNCRLSFPCYQVNARFDGGMSGGPVTNDRGNLCGIICSNLPPSEPDSEHVSYAATLWPLMAIPINIDVTGSPCERSYPLLDLARQGVIKAADWQNVEIIAVEGQLTTVRFHSQG
jgi:hypothetical protein